MASSADEYRELLSSEMFVELDKLRDIAKHGVPEALRGDVWCYLLGVHHPDKCRRPRVRQAGHDRAALTDTQTAPGPVRDWW